MERRGGLRTSLRIVLFAVILFNAVTLIVYFRTQEVRLQYKLSRLQAERAQEERDGRDLAQHLRELGQKENLDERSKTGAPGE